MTILHPPAWHRTARHVLARPREPRTHPPLQLVPPLAQACVMGAGGQCLVCDAQAGEPCRRQDLAA